MKEFTYSVLSYLGGRVHNGLAYSVTLFFRTRSSVINFLQCKGVSGSARKPEKLDSSHAWVHPDVVKISFFLREPIQAASKLLRKNRVFLSKVESLRNTVQASKTASKYAQSIQTPQHSHISKLLIEDNRSRIVASFHFGNFVYGVNKYLCFQADISKTVILSQTESSTAYIENMARAFGDKGVRLENQVLLDQIDVCGLSQFLRQAGGSLIMFADLPREFGETVAVEFLGRQASFSKSIALLSLANSVPILPLVCFDRGGRCQLEIGRQIEPRIGKGESRADAIVRMTQLQIDFFEYFFNRHKEQWRYLYLLPEYFAEASLRSIKSPR